MSSLRATNGSAPTWEQALALHQAGQIARAAAMYRAILAEQPQHAPARHLLGVACQQLGQFDEALGHLGQAIALSDRRPSYHNNYGVALRSLGRMAEAETAFGRALALNPHYADAHSNLGIVLHETGRLQAALRAFQQALRLEPDHDDAAFNGANLLQDLGRLTQAAALYRRLLERRPAHAAAWNNLGNACLGQGDVEQAIACFSRAAQLAPDSAETHLNLGTAWSHLEQVEEAARCFDAAARLGADRPLWGLRRLGLCPAVFASKDELDRYRGERAAELASVQQAAIRLDERTLTRDGFTPSFYFSHHGRDNRPLKEAFAALWTPHFPKHGPPRSYGAKPRVGFVVTQGHEGGFLRSLGGLIERLDRVKFQPVVLGSEAVIAACRQNIARDDAQFVGFPSRFDLACAAIRGARCDLLYHWQIGTDTLNYLLPMARLAPIQCTGWGTHGTSGIAAVDHYLSSRWVEADHADAHYTERLWRLNAFPTWQRRLEAPPPTSRSDLGLPEQGALYLAPHRLAKFHPDFDPLLAGVLEGDGAGRLVVLSGKHPAPLAELRRRWERTLGTRLLPRVLFLPTLSAGDFRRLLSVCDVFLDAPHYSAGFMAYDAFAVGLPIVTLPGAYAVGRWTLGCYLRMGLGQLVADSPEDYIRRAVHLGTELEHRRAVQATLIERGDVLLEDPQCLHEHERFFDEALASPK